MVFPVRNKENVCTRKLLVAGRSLRFLADPPDPPLYILFDFLESRPNTLLLDSKRSLTRFFNILVCLQILIISICA